MRLVTHFLRSRVALAGIGMVLTAYSLWQMVHWGIDVPQWRIIECGIVQGLGLGLVFVPISTIAYSTLPMSSRTEAAGIFSLMRNIGSSVGISIVMTLLSRGTQVNHAELAERLNPFDAPQSVLHSLTSSTGMATLNAEVTRQASAIAFLNDFQLMMWMTVISIPLLLLLRPVKTKSAPAIVADH